MWNMPTNEGQKRALMGIALDSQTYILSVLCTGLIDHESLVRISK